MIAKFFFSDGSHMDVLALTRVRGLAKRMGQRDERPIDVQFFGPDAGEAKYSEWRRDCLSAVSPGIKQTPDRHFAAELGAMAKPYETWLTVMRFGMPTLEADQPLMIKLLCDRISQMVAGDRTQDIDGVTRKVLDDLGLQIVRKGGAA